MGKIEKHGKTPRPYFASGQKFYSRYGQNPRQRVQPKLRDTAIKDGSIQYEAVKGYRGPPAATGRGDFVFSPNASPIQAGTPSLLKYVNVGTSWYR
mmetsp:Transcript_50906/g.90965  ORF Transcript_50906/g.90965 Transcript_50906/m.90965 type:complete len:96 (+) Transcript_50906:2735-3022(+)